MVWRDRLSGGSLSIVIMATFFFITDATINCQQTVPITYSFTHKKQSIHYFFL